MQKAIILLIFVIITLGGCNKLDIEKGTPKCVEGKIDNLNKIACDDGANVKEYTFQGKTVYVFYPGVCGADMTSEVIDSECNSLGLLGGISGNTKISGEEFSNAVFVKTTWEK